jgi:hypothetical protein
MSVETGSVRVVERSRANSSNWNRGLGPGKQLSDEQIERQVFEQWLRAEHKLESEWDETRNCYTEFAAHLAFCAWKASAVHRLSQPITFATYSINLPKEQEQSLLKDLQDIGVIVEPAYCRMAHGSSVAIIATVNTAQAPSTAMNKVLEKYGIKATRCVVRTTRREPISSVS